MTQNMRRPGQSMPSDKNLVIAKIRKDGITCEFRKGATASRGKMTVKYNGEQVDDIIIAGDITNPDVRKRSARWAQQLIKIGRDSE